MNLTLLKRMVLWFVNIWFKHLLTPIQLRKDTILFFNTVQKWINTKGLLWTIKRIKLLRLLVTKYLSGQPIVVHSNIIGIHKDGFPKSIDFLRKYIDEGPQGLRFILTLLGSSRAMDIKVKPDYSSITDPLKKGSITKLDPEKLSKIISDFRLELTVPEFNRQTDFYWTSKAGPLGSNALLTCLHHLAIMPGVMLNYMFILSPYFVRWLVKFRGLVHKMLHNPSKYGKIHRRLSIVNDPEGKARVIALIDYFTQVVLNPYSKQMFDILRNNFPCDRTFTQNPIIKDKTPNQKFWSIDLTAATDRFPLSLQVQIFSLMVKSPVHGWAWGQAMVSLPFMTPEGKMIKYAVGQPMGARTSWTMFTISHHIVVQYAALLEGVYPFKQYILLGDDIVIYHDKVAKRYIEIIESLGVDTSPMKTHVSETTYEFAKRWFHLGREVTGIPLNGFYSERLNPIAILSNFLELWSKGNTPDHFVLSIDISLKFARIFTTEKYKFPRIKNLMKNLYALYRYQRGSDIEIRNLFAEATVDNLLHMPQYGQAMLTTEVERVGSFVANGILWDASRKVDRYFGKIAGGLDKLTSLLPQNGELSLEILKELPVLNALFTTIKDLDFLTDPDVDQANLVQIVDLVNMVDIDSVINRERASRKAFVRMSSFANKMFSELQFGEEIYVPKTRSIRVAYAFYELRNKFQFLSIK